MAHKSSKLFSVSQAANACGISRSTLLRMEEKGLVNPVYINPESGRRYYDSFNISSCAQIKKFQKMGFSSEEILAYYGANGDGDSLLHILEDRLQLLQRFVEELHIIAPKEQEAPVQTLYLPAVTCYTKTGTGLSVQDTYDLMEETIGECIEKGYELSGKPVFVIQERTDYLEGYIAREPSKITTCVPIAPPKDTKDVTTFPSRKAISLLYHGDYSRLDAARLQLGEEIKKRGLKPTGYMMGIGIISPAAGQNTEEQRYCSRLAVPVE